jgi:hypothetical protein
MDSCFHSDAANFEAESVAESTDSLLFARPHRS